MKRKSEEHLECRAPGSTNSRGDVEGTGVVPFRKEKYERVMWQMSQVEVVVVNETVSNCPLWSWRG